MPDLVPKILTGVMGEFWDDVPGRDVPGARAGDGPFAAIRPVSGPVLSAMRRKPRQAVQQLARGARGAARTWSRRLWQCSTIRRKPSSRRAVMTCPTLGLPMNRRRTFRLSKPPQSCAKTGSTPTMVFKSFVAGAAFARAFLAMDPQVSLVFRLGIFSVTDL